MALSHSDPGHPRHGGVRPERAAVAGVPCALGAGRGHRGAISGLIHPWEVDCLL